MQRKRLDQILVALNKAKSRTQAQDFIELGLVYLIKNNKKMILDKASAAVTESDWPFIEVEASKINRFVSRAGLKLEGAMERLKLEPRGWNCLDLGISTGGFTDYLLKKGASQVVGVDVGHDQLAVSLRGHPQLTLLEGENARYLLDSENFRQYRPKAGFDFIVADVSFISLSLVIPNIAPILAMGGSFLGLVKPQFEVGPRGLDKNGIVNNPNLYLNVESTIRNCCQNNGLSVIDYFSSSLPGKDGNQEFFVFAKLT